MAFVKVARSDEIRPGEAKRVIVDDLPVAVFNVDGRFYAIEDTCSHEEASLSEGEVDGEVVECPRHGAQFNIRTGRALSLPAVAPVETFAIKVEGGDVFVDVD